MFAYQRALIHYVIQCEYLNIAWTVFVWVPVRLLRMLKELRYPTSLACSSSTAVHLFCLMQVLRS